MINIPANQINKALSGLGLKKESNPLDIHKMKGARFSGKGVRHGSLTSGKKSGLAGGLRKEINKSTIFGTSRKTKYKNLSNDDLETMSGLISCLG